MTVLLQSQFVGVGRVCCDSNGRLNAKSVIIESVTGKTVPMDISQVENFSLFPGQVIVVEGENPLGSKLCAKKIYTDASLPLPPNPSLSTEEHGKWACVIKELCVGSLLLGFNLHVINSQCHITSFY